MATLTPIAYDAGNGFVIKKYESLSPFFSKPAWIIESPFHMWNDSPVDRLFQHGGNESLPIYSSAEEAFTALQEARGVKP